MMEIVVGILIIVFAISGLFWHSHKIAKTVEKELGFYDEK